MADDGVAKEGEDGYADRGDHYWEELCWRVRLVYLVGLGCGGEVRKGKTYRALEFRSVLVHGHS